MLSPERWQAASRYLDQALEMTGVSSRKGTPASPWPSAPSP